MRLASLQVGRHLQVDRLRHSLLQDLPAQGLGVTGVLFLHLLRRQWVFVGQHDPALEERVGQLHFHVVNEVHHEATTEHPLGISVKVAVEVL